MINPSPSDYYMQRALELAALGKGSVSPNPLVGCVIVHDNKIIGEGWHKKYGEAHAEVNAVNSVENKELLKESTVFVTLEPCSHFGKTPPCADLLIREQVKKVIICNTDPFLLVNGKGVEKLRNAGIEVETSLLETEGRALNKRFFTFVEQKRPYIFLKWAESADGFISPAPHQPSPKGRESKLVSENVTSSLSHSNSPPLGAGGLISSILSRTLVHKMRAEEDAIMVGTNTVSVDNPQLNTRLWHGRNPVRVVLDRNLRLPQHLHLFDKLQPTICYNLVKNEELENLTFVRLEKDENLAEQIVADLYNRKIQSLIVEGGTQLLNVFLKANLWDETLIFKSKNTLGNGVKAPIATGSLNEVREIGEDRLFHFLPNIVN
jgi:diaminohydroxyphosphoribosylaminopyrimidine deaminase/5-amino-6-(5-phosphoribosylamino)uracil reductase